MDETPKFNLNNLPLPIVHSDFYVPDTPAMRAILKQDMQRLSQGIERLMLGDNVEADEPTIVENNTELPGDQDGQS